MFERKSAKCPSKGIWSRLLMTKISTDTALLHAESFREDGIPAWFGVCLNVSLTLLGF